MVSDNKMLTKIHNGAVTSTSTIDDLGKVTTQSGDDDEPASRSSARI